MEPVDLEDRLQDLLDGNLSGKEREVVFAELDSDPEARRLYLELVHLDMTLELSHQPAPSISSTVVPMDRVLARQRRKTFRLAALSAAAVLMVAAIIAIRVILPDPPLASFRTSPETELVLSHPESGGRNSLESDQLGPGSRVLLTSGVLELQIASGVVAVVRAPADFTLESASKVVLQFGTAWFHVEEQAIGFQVETPEFLLTDLGTELGIVSHLDAEDEVHVLSGEVEVLNKRGSKETLKLSTAEARRSINSGLWTLIDFEPERFLPKLPLEELLPPHLYWSFDRIRNGRVPTAGTSPNAGKIDLRIANPGEGPSLVAGRVKGAFAFDAQGDGLVSNWPGIPGTKPRSIAFWIKLPGDDSDYDGTLLNWGKMGGPRSNSEWFVRATNFDYMNAALGRGRRVASTRLQLHFGSAWFIGTTDLGRGEWHHVAICYGGEVTPDGQPTVQFYLDGQPERARFYEPPSDQGTPLDTITDTGDALPLTVGRSRSNPVNSCNALLDELYIFESELSATSVRALANP